MPEDPLQPPPDRSRPRKAFALLVALLLGGSAATLATVLIPSTLHELGPAEVSARAVAGPSETSLLFPPLGTVVADTHRVPLRVSVSLSEVDLAALADEVQDPSPLALRRLVEGDLRELVRLLALRTILAGGVFGAIALALLPRRRMHYVIAGAVGGTLTMCALLGLTAVTYDETSFQEPRFTGALERAPIVLEAIQQGRVTLPGVRSRYQGAAERISTLLALLAEPDRDPRENSTAVLHISDIHSNPIGVEVAQQLASRFQVDAVLDTGDLANFGVQLETRMADLVGRFEVPYFFVPGNHDSSAVRAALERTDNVTVVDEEVVDIAGARVLGWADPTYTNWDSLPPGRAAEVRRNEGERVLAAVRELRPDVLAVHDSRIAEASIGYVPLILSGHYHRQIREEERGTHSLAVGTTGASGFRSFTLEADMDYEAQILYFRDGLATAVDYVTFSGLGGEFQIERKLIAPTILEGAGSAGTEGPGSDPDPTGTDLDQ